MCVIGGQGREGDWTKTFVSKGVFIMFQVKHVTGQWVEQQPKGWGARPFNFFAR